MRTIGELIRQFEGFDEPVLVDAIKPTFPFIPPLSYDPGYVEPEKPPMQETAIQVVSPNDIVNFIPTGSGYSIIGSIFNSKGKPINNASVAMRIMGNPKDETQPVQLPNNSYSIEIQDSSTLDNYGVMFRAPGYKSLFVPLSILKDSPTVTLSGAFPYWIVLAVIIAVIAYRKKTGKVGKLETKDVVPIMLIVGGGISLIIIVKVLQSLGILGSGKNKKEQSDPNSAWKPTYWKQFTKFTYAITTTQAESYSRQIYNAFTLIQDNYNEVRAVFNKMQTKANVSFLADVFQAKYGVDLLTYLGDGGGVLPWDGLSVKHIDELIDLVDNLPSN